MKRKWWIVGILVFLELLICVAILLTLWVGRTAFEGIRFFYRADTHVEETVEETFFVDGPAVLDLEAEFGDVTVTGSEGDEVEVTARLNLWGSDEEDARRQVDVQMTQEGNRINVRVVRPEWAYVGFASTRSPRVDFEIRVPSETSLQLATSSGDLAVSGVTGTAKLETSFGNIEVEEVRGLVSAQSDSGDITLIGLSEGGDLEAETNFGKLVLRDITADSLTAHSDSGDVQVEAVTLDGVLDLRTNFGDIEVRNATEAELTLKTDSGRIYFSGSLHAEGVHLVESGFGKVHLVLPADAAFDLDAETDFGSIKTDFAVTVTEFEEKHIVGEVNRGGPPLQIHTDSGDITLESATGENR